jgi:hypothetical protein
MPDEQKKIVPIDYTHREFNSIRKDLLQVAERFYSDTFQDFSEGSFAAMMTDMVAYVGDQLSFYLDYSVNESFLDTAYQYDNVLRQGRILGYKYTGRPSTYGKAALYILIPASATGIGPDRNYIPVMKRGSRFTSKTGLSFVLTENVDFSSPENPIVAARTNTTGAPTFYAVKAYGNVVSGYFGREKVTIGSYERFKKVTLKNSNMAEIISVTDAEGNEYYEVEYLAQDMVFKEVVNNNYRNDNVPSILKPYLVSRKFVVERGRNQTTLQFGSGDSSASTRLSKTESYGIVPANTTLYVVYRNSEPLNSNIAVGSLNKASGVILDFKERQALNSSTISTIINSVEVNNEEPIIGNVTNATTEEIKRRIFDTFPTQNRAVTQADYENVAYRMPAKFGSIKRCSVQRDPDPRKRNLNMYIVSENKFRKLIVANSSIKNNLKTWLNQYRMISDTIDIIDVFIVNFGIEFVVTPGFGVDKYDVLELCTAQLKNKFNTHFYIGDPISITDIYAELGSVKGVLDVVKVRITNKTGGRYSAVQFNINDNMSPDGTYIIIPKNVVAELKFPETDIKGKIR